MDRKIPKDVLRKEKRKRGIKYGAVLLSSIVAIAVIISLLRDSISLKNIQLSAIDKGTIEVTVSASGKVMPAFEETVIAPIESRIMKVNKRAGDSVDVGTPLLQLDLQSIETDYRKMLDELQMRQYRIEQQRIKNSSTLSDMEMQLKVNDMQIDKMAVEVVKVPKSPSSPTCRSSASTGRLPTAMETVFLWEAKQSSGLGVMS